MAAEVQKKEENVRKKKTVAQIKKSVVREYESGRLENDELDAIMRGK